MTARAWLMALGALALLACGGGGGGGGGGVATVLQCSGSTAPGLNQVEFECPATATSPMALRVVIGLTTTPGIYGIKFDVVFDPAVIAFDPPAIEGTFLNQDGGSTVLEAGIESGDPGRVVVALTRQGAVAGVGSTGAKTTVVTLPFTGLAAGTTSLAFENGEAVDAALAPIPAIQFGPAVDIDVR